VAGGEADRPARGPQPPRARPAAGAGAAPRAARGPGGGGPPPPGAPGGGAPRGRGGGAEAVAWVSSDELGQLDCVDGLREFLAAHGVLERLA
jgi:hypothetical protein